MTNTYLIRVIVDPGGAVRGINSIAQSLDRLEGKANKIGGYFQTLFAVHLAKKAIGGVIKLGDAYTDLESKVRNASGKNDLLTISMDKVFKAANRARTDVSAFGKTVLAISGATANMNLGFDASVRMTETLAKMMKISGALTQEARSATLQYGQALRKGILNGDEMRSVMENSIELQKVLAKTMGISTDELLKQSKAGKITRAVMVDALIKSADEVDRKFAQMSMKVSDAWTVIENAAIRFAGTMKINETLAPILLFIADNFDTIAKTAMVAADVIGTYFVRRGIMMAISGLAKLSVFLLANPFTALLYGVTAAIAALRIFGKDMQIVGGKAATWGDFFAEAWDRIKSTLTEVGQAFGRLLESAAAFFGEMVDISDISVKDVIMFFAFMADSIIKIFTFLKEVVVDGFSDMGRAAGEQFINAVSKAHRYVKGIMWGDENPVDENGVPKAATPGLHDLATKSRDQWLAEVRTKQDAYMQDEARLKAAKRAEAMGKDAYEAERQASIQNLNRKALETGGGFGILSPSGAVSRLAATRLDKPYAEVLAEGRQVQIRRGENDIDAFRGGTEDFSDRVARAWEKLTDKENVGPIAKALERTFKGAEERHGKDKDTRKGLGDFGGKVGAPPEDKEAERERKRALKDWEALQASVNGVYKAELELSKAQETINEARRTGVEISAEKEAMVLMRKREMLQDQLDPYRAMTREIQEQIDGSGRLVDQGEIHAKVLEETNKLWEKGQALTGAQVNNLEQMLFLQRGISDDQKRKEALLTGAGYVSADQQRATALADAYQRAGSPADYHKRADIIGGSTFAPQFIDMDTQAGKAQAYWRSIADIVSITQQWQKEGVAQNVILAGQAALLQKLNEQFGILTERQQSVAEGLREGWQQAYYDMGQTAQQTAQFVQDAFQKMTDAVVTFVTTGKFSFMDLFGSIMKGLSEIATQRFFSEIMKLIGGTSPIGGGGGVTGLIGDNLMEPTFAARGGLFKVSGPGGTDNVPVPMMLSNNEHVRVYPAGQDPGAMSAGRPSVTNVIVVQNTEAAMLHVIQSPSASRTQVQNLTQNEAYLRALQRRS